MSFSIPLEGETCGEVRDRALPAMEHVVEQQPVHEADMDAALGVLAAYLELLGEPPEGMYIRGGMSGSVGVWDGGVQSLSVSVNLQFVRQASDS